MKHISGLAVLLLCGCTQLSLPPAAPVSRSETPAANVPEPNTPPPLLDSVAAGTPVLQLSPALQRQFDSAKQRLQAKEYPQALSAFRLLAQQAPDAAGIWYNLALAQWHSNQSADAIQSLQHAVAVAPQHSASHNLLGVLARQRGDMRAAERYFQQALQGRQPYVAAHKNLAFLYELYLAAPVQAHYHYQQYYQLTQDEQAKLWLALLEQELAQQGNGAGATAAEPILQEDSND